MTRKVLITDYVWPSVEPEKAVLAAGGADILVAPDGAEDTLVECIICLQPQSDSNQRQTMGM